MRTSSDGSPSSASVRTEISAISSGNSISSNSEPIDDGIRIAALEQRIQRLKNELMSSNAKTTQLKSELNELRIQLDQQKNTNSKLELEIRRLARLNTQTTESSSHEIQGINDTVDIIESLLNKQASDIAELSQQRGALVGLVHRYSLASEELEEVASMHASETHELRERIDELEHEYEVLLEKAETDTDLRRKLAPFIPNIDSKDDTQIMNFVKELVERKPDVVVQIDRSRELVLLGHLQNALKLVKTVVLPDANTDDRVFLLTQCSRISQFIEECCGGDVLPNVVSLFDDRDCEAQMNTVIDFIEALPADDAPAQELFALLTGTLYINKMLFSQLDNGSENDKDTQREQQLLVENDNLQRIVDRNEEERAAILDKIANYVHVSSDDLVSAIDSVLYHYEEITHELEEADARNKDLAEQIGATRGEEAKVAASKLKMYEQKSATLEHELENARAEIVKLANEKNKIVAFASEQENRLLNERQALRRKYKSKRAKIVSQIQVLVKENEQLHKAIENLQRKEESLVNEKEIMFGEMRAKEKKAQAKMLDYAERVAELETINKTTLAELKERGKTIQAQYDQQINALTLELTESRNTIDALHQEISDSNLSKQELQISIAKMKLNERALSLRIDQLTDQAQAQESAIKMQVMAQVTAIQTEFEEKIRHERDTVNHYAARLVSLMEKGFSMRLGSMSAEEAIDKFESLVEQKLTLQWKQLREDAITIRSLLGLKPGESLVEAFKERERCYAEATQKNSKLERHNQKLESENESMKCLQKRAEEASEWSKWANSLYSRITDGAIANFSASDVRYTLEEALVSSICHRKLLRRLDTLRSEKVLLSTFRPFLFRSSANICTSSMCPVIAVVVFLQRLDNFVGRFANKSKLRSTISFSAVNI